MAHYRFLVYDVFMESYVGVVTFPDHFGGLGGTWEISLRDVSFDGNFAGRNEISINGIVLSRSDCVEREVRDVMEL